MREWIKPALKCAGGLAVAILVAVTALFVAVYIIRPRLIMRRYDAFCPRHPVGSTVADLLDDPFLKQMTFADMKGFPFFSPGGQGPNSMAALRDAIKSSREGSFSLMWTHTPPFGRLFLEVRFKDDRIVAVRQSELD
jgi:hypothetical protein